ncbi:transposase [Saliniramus sp.]|uniref:transposase n=1 Tax=Saliniramus sp. TaxID=2986772 RepID=UPI0039C9B0F2
MLADREFIGAQWLEFLCENNVLFAIRLREGQLIEFDGGCRISFASPLRRTRHGVWDGSLSDMTTTLHGAARNAAGQESIIIATNTADPKRALHSYAKRWEIECLFAVPWNQESTQSRHIIT